MQGELPAESRKRKTGFPEVPQTWLVSINAGGILSRGAQKFTESEGEEQVAKRMGSPCCLQNHQSTGSWNTAKYSTGFSG